MNKAIVLLSGGLDSATTLYLAKRQGFECLCLIFNYGQRHEREVKSAIRIAKLAKCDYKVIKLDFPKAASSLLGKKLSLPKFKKARRQIPSTYVPARNLVFLSIALSFAESINARAIFIGANAIDYSGYPDCRPKFYNELSKAIRAGTKSGVEGRPIKIHTPLIKKTKKEIVKLGASLGVPFQYTWSCYKGGVRPCGICDSCKLREKGFNNAKIKDPLNN